MCEMHCVAENHLEGSLKGISSFELYQQQISGNPFANNELSKAHFPLRNRLSSYLKNSASLYITALAMWVRICPGVGMHAYGSGQRPLERTWHLRK